MDINTSTIFSSLWSNINNLHSMVTICTVLLILLTFLFATQVCNFNIWSFLSTISTKVMHKVGKIIGRKDIGYHRSKKIGKYYNKTSKIKFYKLVNGLIIDLGFKKKGATPYAFIFILWVGAALFSILISVILFSSTILGILLTPIMFAFLFCVSYTKANLAHDSRIESILEAENIISNNIKNGVAVAIRENINVIPMNIRQEYQEFLDNLANNWHIVDALKELSNNLGSVSDEFIKKCIVFELEEEQGIIGMFRDVVEINNINMEMRTEMKRRFEEINTQFILGAVMISVFLVGVIVIYPVVANFYLTTLIGQLILALDFLIFVLEFVYITYLRATEL